jgi:metallo-beta-lactamase class B
MPVADGGKTYNVMFGCSLRPPAKIAPEVAAEFERTFKTVRSLPCDVQLGDHGAQYHMHEKYALIKAGGPNPFVSPSTCFDEADVEEAMFHATLAEQGGAK